jgi:tetratricopeptide (TPR) repeat protein
MRTHGAAALAMLGRFEQARAVLTELEAELVERGATHLLAAVKGGYRLDVELLAGDAAAAVAAGEESCRIDDELGHQAELSTVAGRLALAFCALGKFEEAERWAARSAELGSTDDATTQMLWRQAQATVLAQRGDHAEAVRLAGEAVAIGEQTEMLNGQADAYADLGEVLALAGRQQEAGEALNEALRRYERKENFVMAERMRARLAELEPGVSGAVTGLAETEPRESPA